MLTLKLVGHVVNTGHDVRRLYELLAPHQLGEGDISKAPWPRGVISRHTGGAPLVHVPIVVGCRGMAVFVKSDMYFVYRETVYIYML